MKRYQATLFARFILATILGVIYVAIVLSSCSVEKKIAKAEYTLKKHDALATICAEEFPVDTNITITLDTVIQTIEYPLTVTYDTTFVDDTVYIREIHKDTIVRVVNYMKEITTRDVANEQALKDKIAVQEKNINKQLGAIEDRGLTIKRLRITMYVGIGIILLLLAYIFRKPLMSLISPLGKIVGKW